MLNKIACWVLLSFISIWAGPIYQDGVLVGGEPYGSIRNADIVDSFPSNAPGYSMGLAWDGKYLWNDDAFQKWFGKTDTLGSLITSFTPTYGNRDMTFDGTYLYATDWQMSQIYKYDTATCNVVASYTPPFGGKPNGMTWTGKYFWVGEEGGQIYLLDTNMTLIRSIPAPSSESYNPRGLAFDGKDLWVGCQYPLQTIFRIDTINGTILEQFNSPNGRYQQGLAWDGRYLWATGGLNWIYKIRVGVNVEERLTDRLEQSTGLRLEVRPNPCRGKVTYHVVRPSASAGNVKVQLLDVCGRPVRTLDEDSAVLQLAPGVYFFRVATRDQSATTKLVVVN